MIPKPERTIPVAWARFRFSVVGSLLSSPPARGDLKTALQSLANKTWTHPATGRQVQFAVGTIERWYYTARSERDDPVRVLERAVRKDRGKITLPAVLIQELTRQHRDHPHWTYQLHYDNLAAVVKADPSQGPLRSYSTVRRYMQAHGLVRKPRPAPKGRPGEERAVQRRESREIRSYEAEYVGSLWHLDFHHGSLKVLTSRGQWARPLILGILDDHSRLCCHLQWYLSETAEDLVHGLSQAIQKRGLPRALLTDNGSAMIADEVTEGLLRLGIVHERTLPYSPYQNGKQESFWGNLEGRLMEMLDSVPELTLEFLNQATQAWAEMEYNRAVHRETGCSPVSRFAQAPDVLRESPTSNALRDAFRLETQRRQRHSDGTISLEGVRFEIPGRYRHFRDVTVRYARWDLSRVDLVDPRTGTILAPLYPLDRRANADSQRRLFELGTLPGDGAPPPGDDPPPAAGQSQTSQPPTPPPLPPLLAQLLAEYSATGTPPAYLPKSNPLDQGAKV
ncbi:MAG: DDE-type integrase/transposase/recombinase [Planctomycetota bacterium]|nr:DDE-type integrase/transposase/recombinase [Planctomycetota bacterium]